MRIFVDYNDTEVEKLLIQSARFIGDYAIRIKFNDDTEKLVDFKPFLTKSLHPTIKKYLDEQLFSGFKLIHGNLNWNDYEMIFPIIDLYNGRI
jgi:hypothetical protein